MQNDDGMESLVRRLRELEERLEGAEQRAEQAEQDRHRERQRAEEAEQDRHRERQRAEEAEEQTRPTTLGEYLAYCHRLVFASFHVESDRELTSKGSITNPRDKLCPTSLEPWPQFLEQQRGVFDILYECFPVDTRAFESRHFLAGLGTRVAQRSIADEKTLESFMHSSVEDPVRAVVARLKQDEKRNSEEVVAQTTPSPPRTPDHRRDLHRIRPDQICIFRSEEGERTMIYVAEYKAPHKLTVQHLRAGLRPMNIYEEVVNRKTRPTADDPENFQYHAERLTASALTQTYHYMIEGGLDYGLLTTGEAMVFLMVDWAEPSRLYYHLAEPGPEVSARPEHVQVGSAVGQLLAFSLMAMGQTGERVEHRQDERERVAESLKTWAEDFETTLRSIPDGQRLASDSGSSWAPTTYEDFDRSPEPRRARRRRRAAESSGPGRITSRREGPSSSSDDEPGPRPPDTPTPSRPPRRSQRVLARRANEADRTDQATERQYCTQACLLGLVRGGSLDPRCPNVASHKGAKGRSGQRHPICQAKCLQLLGEQFRRTLDEGITKLKVHGARGVLFKVTLLAYGYTFVCKGTVKAFIKDLEHEAAVYKRLERLQGIHVPVLLGAVDLRPLKRTYYYEHRVYIVHMTCMSWGGQGIHETGVAAGMTWEKLEATALASLRAIHQQGVIHNDVRGDNMLLNKESGGVMMIDFERAALLQPPQQPLGQLAANKRKRVSSPGGVAGGDGASKRREVKRTRFSDDIVMIRVAFMEFKQGLELATTQPV